MHFYWVSNQIIVSSNGKWSILIYSISSVSKELIIKQLKYYWIIIPDNHLNMCVCNVGIGTDVNGDA